MEKSEVLTYIDMMKNDKKEALFRTLFLWQEPWIEKCRKVGYNRGIPIRERIEEKRV